MTLPTATISSPILSASIEPLTLALDSIVPGTVGDRLWAKCKRGICIKCPERTNDFMHSKYMVLKYNRPND